MRLCENLSLLRINLSDIATAVKQFPALGVDYGHHLRNDHNIHLAKYRLFGIENLGIGVCDKVCSILRCKSVEQLHRHEPAYLGSKENLGPGGTASCIYCNLISLDQSNGFPEQDQFLYFCGQ